MRCAVQNSTRPNPTNIANANPNLPTPAGRVVPVHSWRLVIVPCGLILYASRVRFCLNAGSRVCALCGGKFKIMGLYNRFCKRFFAAVIVRTTAQADSRVQRITCPTEVCRRLADYFSWGFNSVIKENQNAPRPSEYYSILVSLLVDIRVFDYARMLYGIQLIFRSIITFQARQALRGCSV